ncbi:hypothetical protein C9994_11935 [Marivirga lumbricoides]|uniref:Secretion system C-terminal sorting domain-containing protein n=1 Tax=Marivirga lumbricoides TaxID=1046115 RepID=A0A2T4DLJ7_9BACT|nr:hypothetical protein C9994_11935 [Marivirga lumbricoides]
MIKSTLIIFIGILLSWSKIHAQEAPVSAGGNAEGSSGNISYSVGQVLYTSAGNSEILITPGIQQTYSIAILSTSKMAENIHITVFPNPSSEYLTLKTNLLEIKNQNYQVYNSQGKIMMEKGIQSDETVIDTQALPDGVYLFNVLTNGQLIKSFKIIKK